MTAPTVSSAAVDGASLVITFNENLAAATNLANSAFEVKKTPDGGSEETVTLSGSPSISGATVTLTLAAAAVHGDTDVKVSYTRPTSGSDNTLEDAAGNEVATFTGQAVTLTDDGRGVSVSVDKLTLPEADDTSTTDATENVKTYTVALDSEPTGTVTVTVASGDVKVATVSPATLTFTAADYAAQTVTVTAVADALANAGGKRSTTITHTVSATGTDYAGVTAGSVTVEVTDDETAPSGAIALVANPDSLAESAEATTVTVTATLPGSVARDTDTAIAVTVGDRDRRRHRGHRLRHGGRFHADGRCRLPDRHRDLLARRRPRTPWTRARARRCRSPAPPPSPVSPSAATRSRSPTTTTRRSCRSTPRA